MAIDFDDKKHYNLFFNAFKNNRKINSEGNLWKSDEKKWIFDNIQKLDMEMKVIDY